MAKRKPPESQGPSKAYLVSFGDTMTSLLAFFIVLCSLAEEQTGANMYSGTGSFVQALNSFGSPGNFKGTHSERVVYMNESSPVYIVDDPEQRPADRKNPKGPDEESNALPVIDREEEEFQRFLNEMERLASVNQLASTSGETTFDFFEPLPVEPPWVTQDYAKALQQILPVLRKNNYRVEVIVWATTPSPSAWKRAVMQASRFVAEVTERSRLTEQQSGRLVAVGRPWLYSDLKRPVLSFHVMKTDGESGP